jgi:hypothetical protein
VWSYLAFGYDFRDAFPGGNRRPQEPAAFFLKFDLSSDPSSYLGGIERLGYEVNRTEFLFPCANLVGPASSDRKINSQLLRGRLFTADGGTE